VINKLSVDLICLICPRACSDISRFVILKNTAPLIRAPIISKKLYYPLYFNPTFPWYVMYSIIYVSIYDKQHIHQILYLQ
jgi:hypothetical protein